MYQNNQLDLLINAYEGSIPRFPSGIPPAGSPGCARPVRPGTSLFGCAAVKSHLLFPSGSPPLLLL